MRVYPFELLSRVSMQVGDRMVAALVAAAGRSGRAPVLQLHLGFTRISNAGVKGLAGFPSLIAFSCEGELISEGAIQVGHYLPPPRACSTSRWAPSLHVCRQSCCHRQQGTRQQGTRRQGTRHSALTGAVPGRRCCLR